MEIVLQGSKILARLLFAHGTAYTSKFATKSGGFTIMANRLKRFWATPELWPICLSILFGYDIADLDSERSADLEYLLSVFATRKIVYPDAAVIVTSLLQHGMNDILRQESTASSAGGLDEPAPLPSMERDDLSLAFRKQSE